MGGAMKNSIGLLACGLTAAGFFVAPAKGQEQIQVESDAVFARPLMPVAFPPRIADFSRTGVSSYDTDQFNVGANYNDRASSTFATLYVYRAGVEDPRIWADRATTVMLSAEKLGSADLDRTQLSTFSPPDQSGNNSGFRVVAPLSGTDWKSTGLSLFMHDGWLIKLRMSSQLLSPAELIDRMDEFLLSLEMERAVKVYPEFRPMENCERDLSFGREAKLFQLDSMSSVIYGTAFKIVEDKVKDDEVPDSQAMVCRSGYTEAYAVYLYPGPDGTYVMAFGDSGFSASIAKYSMKGLMKPASGYAVVLADGVTKQVLPPFDRKPTPAQVESIINKVGPVVTFDTRPGSDGGTTISVPPTKP